MLFTAAARSVAFLNSNDAKSNGKKCALFTELPSEEKLPPWQFIHTAGCECPVPESKMIFSAPPRFTSKLSSPNTKKRTLFVVDEGLIYIATVANGLLLSFSKSIFPNASNATSAPPPKVPWFET